MMTHHLPSKMSLVVAFTILIFISVSPAQDNRKQGPSISIATNSPVRVLSGKEAKELKKKLAHAAESPIEFDNLATPVKIIEAKVKGAKREEPAGGADVIINDYAMQVSIKLINVADRSIARVGLQFTNNEAKHTFFIYTNAGSLNPQKKSEIKRDFIVVPGNPERLAVQVVGVLFEDKSIWGAFPYPPRGPSSSWAALNPATGIDSKPKLLNSARPSYTVEARRNQILGVVRLSLEVGEDGTVKQIKVISALPDGLTEEAIRTTRQLKFKPATKNGQPVAFWLPIEIDFNLR